MAAIPKFDILERPDPILFFDSGIGGLPYFRRFHDRNPDKAVVYVADRENFPYGSKSKDEITGILIRLASKLITRYNPGTAVLACNTASVSALPALRKTFPSISWVGTVPAIKPAVLESKTRCVGVLGTDRTIEDPYIAELAKKYGEDVKILGFAASDIVRFVEHGGEDAPESEQERAVIPYIEKFRKAGADALVLGCTHFLLLLDTFRKLSLPDIAVYDSVEGVTRRIEKFAEAERAEIAGSAEIVSETVTGGVLLLTGSGSIEPFWWKRAAAFGLDVCLLEEALT